MKIFVFGNPDLAGDNIALRILPKLRKKFPLIQFIHKDPLENWVSDNEDQSGRRLIDRQICDQKIENKKIIDFKGCRISDDRQIYDKKLNNGKKIHDSIVIIDAVQGIIKVRVFNDLRQFISVHKKLTMHDFDLYDELMLLQKLKILPKIAIIGIPWGVKEKDIWKSLVSVISSL
ncbi:hypothetical protein EPN15_02395 [Patescibacteria group bacterium]|nr:MAG: hypothetical protein EPN15_02395 [Patescibacteria group bacterium]